MDVFFYEADKLEFSTGQ